MKALKILIVSVVLVAGLGYGGAKAYIHHKVSESIDSALMMTTPYADVNYTGVSSTLDGELTLDNVTIRVKGYRDDIAIESLGIKTDNFLELLKLADMSAPGQPGGDGPPDSFGFIARNIRVPANADYYQDLYRKNIEALDPPDIRQRGVQCVGKYGFSPQTLASLGYEEMVVSMSLIVRQAENHFVTEMSFDVADMSELDLSFDIGGNAMAGAMMGGAYRPTLHSLELQLTDRSLNQRIVRQLHRSRADARTDNARPAECPAALRQHHRHALRRVRDRSVQGIPGRQIELRRHGQASRAAGDGPAR